MNTNYTELIDAGCVTQGGLSVWIPYSPEDHVSQSYKTTEQMEQTAHSVPVRADDLIYDVGAANGDDTELYLQKGYRVLAIEANPTAVARLHERFIQQLSAGQLTVLSLAIALEPGVCEFYVNNIMEWSSIWRDIGTRGGEEYHTISVPAETLDSVVRKYGMPFYLKLDIEGMDLAAALQLHHCSLKPRYISVESGPTTEWLDGLYGLGYRLFKWIDQTTISPPGSSGPFGEDTTGEWLGYEELRSYIETYFAMDVPDKNLWFDIHAKWQ